jgi:hypothetical protein
MIMAMIYLITHPARPLDVYVGQTIDEENRWRAHRQQAERSPLLLYRWWRKRSRETGAAPIMTVVRSGTFSGPAEAKAWMNEQEIAVIARARSNPAVRLLNLTAGGEGMLDPSPDVRARMSASARARGCCWSDETRAKMIALHRGKQVSAATRAKLSASARARPPRSNETKAKTLASFRLTLADPAARARISEAIRKAHTGRVHGVEERAKRSASLKGRVQPPEERAIRKAAAQARGAKIKQCPRGHAYDESNPKHPKGCRRCRQGRRTGPRVLVTQCPRGHAYDEANPKHPKGCRTCLRARSERWRQERLAALKQAKDVRP